MPPSGPQVYDDCGNGMLLLKKPINCETKFGCYLSYRQSTWMVLNGNEKKISKMLVFLFTIKSTIIVMVLVVKMFGFTTLLP